MKKTILTLAFATIIAIKGYSGFISANGGPAEIRIPPGSVCEDATGIKLEMRPVGLDDYKLSVIGKDGSIIEQINSLPVVCKPTRDPSIEPILYNECENNLEFVIMVPDNQYLYIAYGHGDQILRQWNFPIEQCQVKRFFN